MDGVPVEVSPFKGTTEEVNTIYTRILRRDFTINAIAMDAKGIIFDPFGGQKDLDRKKMIRSPLNQSWNAF